MYSQDWLLWAQVLLYLWFNSPFLLSFVGFSLPKTKLILVVVLPVLTQFLNSNAMVFHSSGSGNMEDLPRKEKSLVIKYVYIALKLLIFHPL